MTSVMSLDWREGKAIAPRDRKDSDATPAAELNQAAEEELMGSAAFRTVSAAAA